MNSRIVVQSAEPVACEDHAAEMPMHDQVATRVAQPHPDPLAHLAAFPPEIQAQVKKKASALWAAAGSVDTDLSFLSSLELYGTEIAERRMPTRRVVEALDVIEHV